MKNELQQCQDSIDGLNIMRSYHLANMVFVPLFAIAALSFLALVVAP